MRYGDSFEKGFQVWNRAKTDGYEMAIDVFQDQTALPHHLLPLGKAAPMNAGAFIPGWLRQQLCLYDSLF